MRDKLEVIMVTEGRDTVAQIRHRGQVLATGEATRALCDVPDEIVGRQVAVARALRLLADATEFDAGLRLVCLEDR